jgi:hypothetical protein
MILPRIPPLALMANLKVTGRMYFIQLWVLLVSLRLQDPRQIDVQWPIMTL